MKISGGPSQAVVHGVMALLTLIWGTTWAAVRLSLTGFPPLAGVAVRFLLAAAVLAVAARVVGQPLGGDRRLRWLWLAQATLTFGLSYSIVYWAEQWVPSGLVSVLFATFPFFVALFARWLLPAERLGRLGIAGGVLGFLGVVTIFSEDMSRLGGSQVRWAAVVMLLSPAAAGLANVAVKRWGSGLGPFALTAVPMAMTGAGLAALSAVAERGRPVVLGAVPVAAVVYLAVVGSALTFTLYFWLLEHIPATQLSMIAYGTPVIAVVIGVLAFGEPLTARIAAGAALVVVGVVLVLRRPRPA